MDPVLKEATVESQDKAAPTVPITQSTEAETQKAQPASGVVYGDAEEEEAKTIKLTGDKVKSADEDETLIYIKKAKIYRFRDGKWKERGDGYCKLLRSQDNKIRFLQRAEKTLKVTANFLSKLI
jgi:hypothetical protein